MWPFRLVTVFRNRWWTLAFAAIVCWMAATSVGAPDTDTQVNAVDPELEAVKQAFDTLQSP